MPNNMKKAGIKYQNGGTGMNGPIPTRKKNPGMPKPQNYIGNPLGYFNDKAQYGVEMGIDGPIPQNADKLMERSNRIFDKATTGSVNQRKAAAFAAGNDRKGQRLINRKNRMKQRSQILEDKARGVNVRQRRKEGWYD